MQMNPHPAAGGHPLMSPGVNPHGIQRPDGSIIKGQNIPGMEAIARTPNVDHKPRDLSSQGSGPPLADSPNGQSPALNLSKSGVGDHGGGGASGGGGGGVGGGGAGSGSGAQSERSNPISPEPSVHEEDENMSEANISDTEEPNDKDEDISDCDRDLHSPVPAVMPVPPDMEAHRQQALNYSSLAASVAVGAVPTGQDPSISSTETLLRNIQGLLKVAADNARQQERQTSYEKGKFARKCATVRQGFREFACASSCAITTNATSDPIHPSVSILCPSMIEGRGWVGAKIEDNGALQIELFRLEVEPVVLLVGFGSFQIQIIPLPSDARYVWLCSFVPSTTTITSIDAMRCAAMRSGEFMPFCLNMNVDKRFHFIGP
uniref:Dachshund n=1 Tax=Anopheles melas TaxID=34690 RepID=A0A182UA35_9DIPT